MTTSRCVLALAVTSAAVSCTPSSASTPPSTESAVAKAEPQPKPSAASSPAPEAAPEPAPFVLADETPPARKRALRWLRPCFQGDSPCHEHVCGGQFGPGAHVLVSTPAPGTPSGMTEDGPVPLGPVVEIEIDVGGRVRFYNLGEGRIACDEEAMTPTPDGRSPV